MAVNRSPGVIAPSDARPGYVPSTDRRQGVVPSSEPEGDAIVLDGAEQLDRFRRMLRDFVDLKSKEIDERRQAWRYYHGKQWEAEELQKLKDRGQPPIVYNRFATEVNAVIGVLERLRQDPKAYPRTPAHETGAEVATQSLRYTLDASEWEGGLSEVILDLCVAGVGGWEQSLEQADDQSFDPMMIRQPADTFFYDPRSLRPDFSDAHFMGVAKWMREDEARTFLPNKVKEIADSVSTLSTSGDADALTPDTDNLWWDAELRKLRVVEVWYRQEGRWLYAVFTGAYVLDEGESPFFDAKGNSACRYVMQSANVDEEGTRYGFLRNKKGPQDEVNHRRSRALHAFNTVRVVVEEGVVQNPDELRAEANRVDSVVHLPEGQSGKIRVESNTDIAMANVQMLQEAKQELDQYSATLIGQGLENQSGRAIALQQQVKMSGLGLFIVRVRSLKLRCYGQQWEAIRRYWTTPRFIRLTDDEGVAGFLGVNQPRRDVLGNVVGMENPIGKLMVDFVLDEGPDTVTLREDAQQAISQAMSAGGASIPAPVLVEMSRTLISTINLPGADKRRIMGAYDRLEEAANAPPSPEQQEAAALQLAQGAAEIEETRASARLKLAQAAEKGRPAGDPLDVMERAAKVDDIQAGATLKRAQAEKTIRDVRAVPLAIPVPFPPAPSLI